jgi:putative membrane protein
MLAIVFNWVLSAAILIIISNLLPGIELKAFGTALGVIAVFSIINVLIRPIITLLTLPLNVLTLGLFTFVINAMMFGLGAYLVDGFYVHDFISALIGSVLLSLGSLMVHELPVTQKG